VTHQRASQSAGQDKYVAVLGERVALWHQGANDAHMARVGDAIAAIKWLERRLASVKQPGTGPEDALNFDFDFVQVGEPEAMWQRIT
jgi:hypothetical protein